jgi:hypothetical protein
MGWISQDVLDKEKAALDARSFESDSNPEEDD